MKQRDIFVFTKDVAGYGKGPYVLLDRLPFVSNIALKGNNKGENWVNGTLTLIFTKELEEDVKKIGECSILEII